MDIKVKSYGFINHRRYEVQVDGKTKFTVKKKSEAQRIETLLRALLVAKERMNHQIEFMHTNDFFTDEEEYQNFAMDIDVVSSALKE